MENKKEETFFANIYRHGDGFMFGDNMITHKTLNGAVCGRRTDLEWMGAVKLDISISDTHEPVDAKIVKIETSHTQFLIPNKIEE